MSLQSISDQAVTKAFVSDRQLLAFCNETVTVAFRIQVVDGQKTVFSREVRVEKGVLQYGNDAGDVEFSLQAPSDVWDKYFVPVPQLG
jgi:hypothetical protein